MVTLNNTKIEDSIHGMNALDNLIEEIEIAISKALNQTIRQIVLPKQLTLEGVSIQFIDTTTMDMKGKAYIVGPVQVHCVYVRPERRPNGTS